MTKTVSLRSGMIGNYHVPFWRAVGVVTPSLTLIILHKGLNILGIEWNKNSGKCGLGETPSGAPFQDSTSGQEGSASENGEKRGERCTSTVDEQSKTASNSL
jgi:hypothetical protein